MNDPTVMEFIFFLDRHLWLYRLLCFLLIGVTGWLAVRPLLRSGIGGRAEKGRGALFVFFLVAALFACRYPIFFYPHHLNVDEAQMVSQALTFPVHPIPWRDMDTGSGGPLDSDVLAWSVPFGIEPSYLTARAFGLSCVAGMLVFLYLACRRLAGEGIARLAVLPVFLFFSLVAMADWVHYTSEHLSLLLLGGGLFLLGELRRRPASVPLAAGLGFVLGLLPFAKLQSVLPGIFLGCAALGILAVRGPRGVVPALRRMLPLVAGALLPAAVILGIVAAAGGFGDFWKSYIEMAGSYAQGGLAAEHVGQAEYGQGAAHGGWFWLSSRLQIVFALILDLNLRLESTLPVDTALLLATLCGLHLLIGGRRLPAALCRKLAGIVLFILAAAATLALPMARPRHSLLVVAGAILLGLGMMVVLVARHGKWTLPSSLKGGQGRKLAFAAAWNLALVATVIFPLRLFTHYLLYLMVGLPVLSAVALRVFEKDLKPRIGRPTGELLQEVRIGTVFVAACTVAVGLRVAANWPGPYQAGASFLSPLHGALPYILIPLVALTGLLALAERRVARALREPARFDPGSLRRAGLWVFLIPFVVLPGVALACYPNPYLGGVGSFLTQPLPPIEQAIVRHRPPGGRLAVWGFQPDYFADTATPCGVRACVLAYSILPSPLQDYYRSRLLEDMKANRPEIFVEAIGPHTFLFHDPATQGIHTFPELAAFIAEEYRLAEVVDGVKLYLRRDLPAAPDAGRP